MFEFAAFTYALIATFVLTSAERNRRQARGHALALERFGWTVMGFSFAAAILMLCWATLLYLRG